MENSETGQSKCRAVLMQYQKLQLIKKLEYKTQTYQTEHDRTIIDCEHTENTRYTG